MSSKDKKNELEALALFERALGQPADKRAEWIIQETPNQMSIREKAMAFLARDKKLGPMLKTGGALYETIDDTMRPERIGAYEITGVIGKGGMGTVYRGKRTSDDFDHDVAIKVVRPGAMSEGLVTRFQSERRTLAKLSHPNIARLYDGGQAENGSPYIVMEYIDGMPITDWANRNELSTDERLNLFRTTCKAIAYAHRNLIIHRDITPANILVDNLGDVKIIDFGLAKPFGADSADADVTYPPIGLSLTPGFAAPERMHVADANTLTDIYSLGKLLENLLGSRALDDDLASIIDKATAMKPEDRYEMASNLEEEIIRYQKGFPISARPASSYYTVSKFIQRHKASSFLVSTTLAGLIAAFFITLSQYQRADLARIEANARFNETRSLANFLINDIDRDLATLPGSLTLKMKVNEVSAQYISVLAEAVKNDLDMELEYALARAQLGASLTDEGGRNLYDPEAGLEHYEASLEILERLVNNGEASKETERAFADIHMKRAYLYRFYFSDLSVLADASKIAEPIYRKLIKERPTDIGLKAALIHLELERWTVDFQSRTNDETLRTLHQIRQDFDELLSRDLDNYSFLVNHVGLLSLLTDYAERKWNVPFGVIPLTDKEEYEQILDWVEYLFSIVVEQVDENYVNPEDVYNYLWGLEVLVTYSTSNLEWRPSTYYRPNAVSSADLENMQELANKLYKRLDIADGLLQILQPFEANEFSYQEAYFENTHGKYSVDLKLLSDFNAAEQKLLSLIAAVDELLSENPEDDYIKEQQVLLSLQYAELLHAKKSIEAVEGVNRSCAELADAANFYEARKSLSRSQSLEQRRLFQINILRQRLLCD